MRVRARRAEEGDGNPADQERPETRGVGDNVREDGALVVDVDGLLGGKPGDGEQTGVFAEEQTLVRQLELVCSLLAATACVRRPRGWGRPLLDSPKE